MESLIGTRPRAASLRTPFQLRGDRVGLRNRAQRGALRLYHGLNNCTTGGAEEQRAGPRCSICQQPKRVAVFSYDFNEPVHEGCQRLPRPNVIPALSLIWLWRLRSRRRRRSRTAIKVLRLNHANADARIQFVTHATAWDLEPRGILCVTDIEVALPLRPVTE